MEILVFLIENYSPSDRFSLALSYAVVADRLQYRSRLGRPSKGLTL